jgi:hypothetical protein
MSRQMHFSTMAAAIVPCPPWRHPAGAKANNNHPRPSRLHITVFRNLFIGQKKPFLPGFLRIFFSCVFRRNFSQERGFGGGRRNSCFLPLSQEFFAGIPAGQEFLYLTQIPPDSSGFRRIPVPAKRCLALASD